MAVIKDDAKDAEEFRKDQEGEDGYEDNNKDEGHEEHESGGDRHAIDAHADPVFTFKAYEALWPRIAKVLAPKERFSAKERQLMLHQEWESDRSLFGSTDRDYLLKDEFSKSMYQLLDEWSGGVESVELFQTMLEIILENIAVPIGKSGKQKIGKQANVAYDDAVQLKLKPLRAISCCYQKLMDKRYAINKKVSQNRSDSFVIKDQAKLNGKKQKVDLTKLVETRSMLGGAARQSNATSPKDLVQFYKKMFDSIDEDASGHIDRDELKLLAVKLGRPLADDELDAAMVEMDADKSGSIDFDEFFAWFSDVSESDQIFREAFDKADLDNTGSLDRAEVRLVLKQLGDTRVSKAKLESAMREMDPEQSGRVTFDSFQDWWNRRTSLVVLAAKTEDPREVYLRKQFDKADTDSSGAIDRSELSRLLENIGRPLADSELQLAFELMDDDNSGTIEWLEFKAWFQWLERDDKFLYNLFDSVDKDDSGTLDRAELAMIINSLSEWNKIPIDLDAAMASMDKDNSGEVDREEFEEWWTNFCAERSEEMRNRYTNQNAASDTPGQRDEGFCDRTTPITESAAESVTHISAIQRLQSAWRKKMVKPHAGVRFELAGKSHKLAQQGDWKRGRSRVIVQAQMRASISDVSARPRGISAVVAVDKQILRVIEDIASSIHSDDASSQLWAFCRSRHIDTFGIDVGIQEVQALKSALRGLSVEDVYKAIDVQRSSSTAKLWEVVYRGFDENRSTVQAAKEAARAQLRQNTPVQPDNFERQLAAADLPELQTMCARLAASMDAKMWSKPNTLAKQAKVLALDLTLHMVETELHTHQKTRETEGMERLRGDSVQATLPQLADTNARTPREVNADQKSLAPASAASRPWAPMPPPGAAPTAVGGRSRRNTHAPVSYTSANDAGNEMRRPLPSIAPQSSVEEWRYHDSATGALVSPRSSCSDESRSVAPVLSFSSVTAVEERAKAQDRYGCQTRPTLVPTFDLLALLGKRVEVQSTGRAEPHLALCGLLKEELLQWENTPRLGYGADFQHRRTVPIQCHRPIQYSTVPMLQPGSSVVAPLTQAQERRLRKKQNAAWKNRHVQQLSGITPYDDYRTSTAGIPMIAQVPRQPRPSFYSARAVAGEADPMGRRGTVAALRLGGDEPYTQRATKGTAESQAVVANRNQSKSSEQREQRGERPTRRRLVLTKENKVIGPIRAPSPARVPLPTPRLTASPARGLLDVFPDGTRILRKRSRRRTEGGQSERCVDQRRLGEVD